MSNISNLGIFPHTIGNLDDRPNLSAAEMKAKLEQDVMTLWEKLVEVIPRVNDILPASSLVSIINHSSTDSDVPTAKAVYTAIEAAFTGDEGTFAKQIIEDWLDDHPEATTTVQDGSITNAKLASTFVVPGFAELERQAKKYNPYNIIPIKDTSGSNSGITYTTNNDGSYTISGTASANSYYNLWSAANGDFPAGLEAGGTYELFFNGFGSVLFQMFKYTSGTLASSSFVSIDGDYSETPFVFEVPSDADGVLIRFRVMSGTAITTAVTVDPCILATKTCDQLTKYLYKYNSVDAFELYASTSTSLNGIDYTKNADGSWTIYGTASGTSYCNLLGNIATLPPCIIPGRDYYLNFHGGNIPVQVFFYDSDGTQIGTYQTITQNSTIHVPENASGVIMRLRPNDNATVDTIIKYTLVSEDLTPNSGGGGGGTYNYSNTYNITTSPEITTDTNGWLKAVDTDTEDETGKTDMTGAIMSMLNSTGYCHLGEGIFYVSGNIDMPENSVLCGCGEATTIRLLASVSSGYCVRMQKYCTIKDVSFSGSFGSVSITSNGHRDAVHFTADYDGSQTGSPYTTQHCMMSNVWISKFSGSGIYCHNTSISVSRGLYVTNAYISTCYAGINIDYYSEFNKFTNVFTGSCYYGVINNGGNNVFTACTFHATNVGFYIDGSQPNSAHGTINGCTFCHIGSNNGIAFKAENVTAGFIVSNCQIWYNSIVLANCQGILLEGCMFGRGISDDGAVSASITVTGGNLVMFSGCMFHLDVSRPPKITITNNTKTVFSGCYGTESGHAITA